MTTFNRPELRGLNRRQFLQITAASTAAAALYLAGRHLRPGSRFTTFSETRTLMGTVINLAIVSADADAARRGLAATFAEMERLIALFDHRRPQSALVELNRTGELDNPPAELHALIERAQQYSVLSGGAFDISVKPLLDAARAGAPDAAAYRRLVDYRRIEVQPGMIRLGQPGMALTLDGIAKGRVVDGATAVLQAAGFPNIMVEAGGDLMALGTRADGRPWRVGVSHPRQAQAGLVRLFPLAMQAVATSGDYMHRFSQDFRRHHILIRAAGTPRPAWPAPQSSPRRPRTRML